MGLAKCPLPSVYPRESSGWVDPSITRSRQVAGKQHCGPRGCSQQPANPLSGLSNGLPPACQLPREILPASVSCLVLVMVQHCDAKGAADTHSPLYRVKCSRSTLQSTLSGQGRFVPIGIETTFCPHHDRPSPPFFPLSSSFPFPFPFTRQEKDAAMYDLTI